MLSVVDYLLCRSQTKNHLNADLEIYVNGIALDLWEAHKDDFFSVPEDNPLEAFLQTAEETARENSDPEQSSTGGGSQAQREKFQMAPDALSMTCSDRADIMSLWEFWAL